MRFFNKNELSELFEKIVKNSKNYWLANLFILVIICILFIINIKMADNYKNSIEITTFFMVFSLAYLFPILCSIELSNYRVLFKNLKRFKDYPNTLIEKEYDFTLMQLQDNENFLGKVVFFSITSCAGLVLFFTHLYEQDLNSTKFKLAAKNEEIVSILFSDVYFNNIGIAIFIFLIIGIIVSIFRIIRHNFMKHKIAQLISKKDN